MRGAASLASQTRTQIATVTFTGSDSEVAAVPSSESLPGPGPLAEWDGPSSWHGPAAGGAAGQGPMRGPAFNRALPPTRTMDETQHWQPTLNAQHLPVAGPSRVAA